MKNFAVRFLITCALSHITIFASTSPLLDRAVGERVNLTSLSSVSNAATTAHRFRSQEEDQVETARLLGISQSVRRRETVCSNVNQENSRRVSREVEHKVSELTIQISRRRIAPEEVANQVYEIKKNHQEILDSKVIDALNRLANNILVKVALSARIMSEISKLELQLRSGKMTHAAFADVFFSLKVKYGEWLTQEAIAQLDQLAKNLWTTSAIFTKITNTITRMRGLCDRGLLTAEAAAEQICFVKNHSHLFEEPLTGIKQLEADPRIKAALTTRKVRDLKQLWDEGKIRPSDVLNRIEHFKTTCGGSLTLEARRLLSQLEQEPRIVEKKQEQEAQREQEERRRLKKEWKKAKIRPEIEDYKHPLYGYSGRFEALIDAYYLTRLGDYPEAVHSFRFVEGAGGRSSKIFEKKYYQDIFDYLLADEDFQRAYPVRIREERTNLFWGSIMMSVFFGTVFLINFYFFGSDSSKSTDYDWGNTSVIDNISAAFASGGALLGVIQGNGPSNIFSPSSITPPPALAHEVQGNATVVDVTTTMAPALAPVLAPSVALAQKLLNIVDFTPMLLKVLEDPGCLSVPALSLLGALHQFSLKNLLPEAVCVFFKAKREVVFSGFCVPSKMQDYPSGANATCDANPLLEITGIRKDLVLIQLGSKGWKSVVAYPFNPTQTAELTPSAADFTNTHSDRLTADRSNSFSMTKKRTSQTRRKSISSTPKKTDSDTQRHTVSDIRNKTASRTPEGTDSGLSGTKDNSVTVSSDTREHSLSVSSVSQTLTLESACSRYNRYLLENATAYGFLKTTPCDATTLILTNRLINASEMMSLVPAMQQLTKLTGLYLSGDNIGAAGVGILAPAIQNMFRLSVLYLNNNNLGVAGARALFPVFQQLTSLTILALFTNNLGDTGAVALLPVLQNMTQLKTLYLNNNNINATTQAEFRRLLPNVTTLVF